MAVAGEQGAAATAESSSPAVPQPSAEREARALRSIAILKTEGVPFTSDLPGIEIEAEAKRRTADEVAMRAVALIIIATRAREDTPELIAKAIRRYEADSAFSPKERAFLGAPKPSDRDRAQFVWRFEAAWVLLWALGYVDQLERPERPCDVQKAVRLIGAKSKAQLVGEAKLRPLAEILDAADLIYRYHWAVRDAELHQQPVPARLDGDVVMERHYVLNWLIGAGDQAWDEVSTDT